MPEHRCFMGYEPAKDEEGAERYYVLALPELTVYGHTVDEATKRDYPEDFPRTVSGRAAGYEFACWHSAACTDGEIGSNGVDGLRRIDRQMFLDAWDAGWPDLPPALNAPVIAIFTVEPDGSLREYWDSMHGKRAESDPKRSDG